MTRLAVRTGAPDDLIDALLTRSHGDILRAPADSSSGEYDSWRQQFSRRDIRRLVAAGLIGPSGWAADVFASRCGFDGTPDECVSWWCAEGLRGLDIRATRRPGGATDWANAERPADDVPELDTAEVLARLVALEVVPEWWHAWIERTVHAPKLDALVALAAETWLGEPMPTEPTAKWWPKVRSQFARRNRGTTERETP